MGDSSHTRSFGAALRRWPKIFVLVLRLVLSLAAGLWPVWVSVAVFGALIGVSWLIVDVVPPSAATRSRLWAINERIDAFVSTHHRLPLSLDELPQASGTDNSIVDSWGRRIDYKPIEEYLFTLSSLGKDGLPGGKGEDADISKAFSPREAWRK